MKLIKIKDIGQVVSGSTPKTGIVEYWNGSIPWVTPKEVSNLDTPILQSSEKKITELGFQSCSTKILPPYSILFTSRAPIGLVAINKNEVCTNQGFKSIVLNKGINPLYIYYVLKSNVKQLNNLGTGSTFKELSKSTFENFEIPIFPEHEQAKIAILLNEVEELIAYRKKSILMLDELTKSVYFKMFGDPALNKMDWPTLNGGEFSERINVGVVIKPASYYASSGVLALRSLNIKPNYFDLSDVVYFDEASHQTKLAKSILQENDVVIVRTGKTGTAAVIPKNLEGSNCIDLLIVRPNRKVINPYYLSHFLNSENGASIIASKEVGGVHKHFNLGELKKLNIPIPPVQLQNSFENFVNYVGTIKSDSLNGLTEFNNLYNSIRQRVFKGELDFSSLSLKQFFTKNKIKTDNELRNLILKNPASNISPNNPLNTDTFASKKQKTIKNKTSENLSKSKEIDRDVTMAKISEWLNDAFLGKYFTIEMFIRYCKKEKNSIPNYLTSKELKENRKVDLSLDLKEIIFQAIKGDNKRLQIEQFFYDGVKESFLLELRKEDYDLFIELSPEERTGIYLRVKP